MRLRHHALCPWKRWPTCPALLLVITIAAGCASSLDNQPRPTADAGPDLGPASTEPVFPNAELSLKYEAVKASPRDFEVLHAYARAIADHTLASLVDTSCGAACTGGIPKYKPVSELDPKNWVLVQSALAKLDVLKTGEGLPPTQFEPFVGVKGRLLGLAGLAAEEKTLIEGYVLAHPDAVVVVKRRLEMLREAGNVEESESQCTHSRGVMKSAPDTARTELLTMCVALHPANKDGKSDSPDYAEFLPNPSKAEQRLYRKHVVQRCIENVGSKEKRCAEACACKDKPDKPAKAKCKEGCTNCRVDTAQRIRNCKKTGTPDPPKPTTPRPKGTAPGSESGPEPQTTVL